MNLNALICITLAFAVLYTSEACGNEAPIQAVGKTVMPRSDAPVRLISEEVTITIDDSTAYVTCYFNLLNEGPQDTIDVGFPRGWEGELYDFTAKIGQHSLDVKTTAPHPQFFALKPKWWKTFRVPFDSTGHIQRVENRYWTRLNNATPLRLSDLYFRYIIRTGAFWQGSIGDAKFHLVLKNIDPNRVKLSPKGYQQKGNHFSWHFKNFEPEEDLEVWIKRDVLYQRSINAQKRLEANPNDAEALFLLGTVLYWEWEDRRENLKKSYQAFEKAFSIDTTLPEIRWFLSSTSYLQAGIPEDRNYKGAIALMEPLLRENPDQRCCDETIPDRIMSKQGCSLTVKEWVDQLRRQLE